VLSGHNNGPSAEPCGAPIIYRVSHRIWYIFKPCIMQTLNVSLSVFKTNISEKKMSKKCFGKIYSCTHTVQLRTLNFFLKNLHLRINYRFKYIPHSVRHPVYIFLDNQVSCMFRIELPKIINIAKFSDTKYQQGGPCFSNYVVKMHN
jgi:hypothetical protein